MTDEFGGFGPLFDKALRARHEGNFEHALQLCTRVLNKLGPSARRAHAAVNSEMGYIHLTCKRFKEAESHYRYALGLFPKAELASIGLFQSLVEQGRLDEAFEEAIRLVSLRDSPEYRDILAKAYTDVEILDPRLRRLANRARAILRQRSADKDG